MCYLLVKEEKGRQTISRQAPCKLSLISFDSVHVVCRQGVYSRFTKQYDGARRWTSEVGLSSRSIVQQRHLPVVPRWHQRPADDWRPGGPW